jgi:hypothetical protein
LHIELQLQLGAVSIDQRVVDPPFSFQNAAASSGLIVFSNGGCLGSNCDGSALEHHSFNLDIPHAVEFGTIAVRAH